MICWRSLVLFPLDVEVQCGAEVEERVLVGLAIVQRGCRDQLTMELPAKGTQAVLDGGRGSGDHAVSGRQEAFVAKFESFHEEEGKRAGAV